MTIPEAKQILLLYRPDIVEEHDHTMAEALDLARIDPELRDWFEAHCQFQSAMRDKFQSLPAPQALRQRVLAQRKVVPLPDWWRPPAVWSAAAAVLFLLGLAVWWNQPTTTDSFANFRARMVKTVLREYRMDIVTNDLAQVRQFMAKHNAPADWTVPRKLIQLELTGGGLLRWRNHPVSMICFDRGDAQMLFLFVLEGEGVEDAPPLEPQIAQVNKLLTVSWSQGGKTYLLAGPPETGFEEKYL